MTESDEMIPGSYCEPSILVLDAYLYYLPHGLLFDPLQERTCHLKFDVRLQKRDSDYSKGLTEVFLGEGAHSLKVLPGVAESSRQNLEHEKSLLVRGFS